MIIYNNIFLLIIIFFILCYNSQSSGIGSGQRFANQTIWATMILTDPMTANILGRDFHRIPQGVNGTQIENAWRRVENGKKMTESLPFKVTFWWSIWTQPCPQTVTKSKGNDRGVMMAHWQIWADWIYQGKKGNDKNIAKDYDIMVVFEDDAVIAVKNVEHSLNMELGNMNTDLLFLGWCYGRKYIPMCTHAYAITRSGAKKMLAEWDICSKESIDGQWKNMANEGLFSWQKASSKSYSDLKPGFEDNPHYFTRGIFIQKNGLVSFNHHGFQNNAG